MSLTILGPSPKYFCTNSDPHTLNNKNQYSYLMKEAAVLLATALASIVFPVPGGP